MALDSLGLAVSMLDPSSFEGLRGFCRRGPVSRDGLGSDVASTGFDISRRRWLNSPLDFGKDDETYGEMAARLVLTSRDSARFGPVVLELLGALCWCGSGLTV